MGEYKENILKELENIKKNPNKANPKFINLDSFTVIYCVSYSLVREKMKTCNINGKLTKDKILQFINVCGLPTANIPSAQNKSQIAQTYNIKRNKLCLYIQTSELLTDAQKERFKKSKVLFPKDIEDIVIVEMGKPDEPFVCRNGLAS